MKKLLFLLLISCQISYAQKYDPRADQFNYVPNEVLVKFADNVQVSKDASSLKSTGIINFDNILKSADIVKLEKLFPQEKTLKAVRVVKDPHGRDMVIPSLHNIYKLTLPALKSGSNEPINVQEYIEQLQALPEVGYAEPNYYYSVNDFTIDSDIITSDEVGKRTKANADYTPPNDPLYSQQTNITATKIDKVWEKYTTGDGSQIIGILDTGSDYEHPDLKDNIWINEAELNGVEGFDDDANGYIDDIRGWDFINLDNAPLDDNMHGTHVAGIAGAVGGNGIGIAGAAWNVKLMPIKVFQSNGVGNASTIAEGIIYASENGATILNMSFGSYAESITMRLALENAYATSVLVSSAGNDALCIGPVKCPDLRWGYPSYPGSYSFVIGVEDFPRPPFGYTNFDQDGSVFSGYSNLLNYEVKADGNGIISTVPNGGYRTLTGTSMASPLVAGGIALYLQQKPDDNKELLFGNLINTASSYVDFEKAIEVVPTPVLNIIGYQIADTLADGDRDWKADAGETILLNVEVRNTWAQTDSVFVGVKFQEFEDISTALIENGDALIGTIGEYATLTNSKNQLRIKIQPNVIHDRNIQFVLEAWKGLKKEYLAKQNITIRVENGTELKGVLEDTLRLTPDKFWLVSNSFKIAQNGVLILGPGTHLKIEKTVTLEGSIIGNGESNNQVIIEGPFGFYGPGKMLFKHANFTNFNFGGFSYYSSILGWGSGNFSFCSFNNILGNVTLPNNGGGMTFSDCSFFEISEWKLGGGKINNSNFYDLKCSSNFEPFSSVNVSKYCNFSKIDYKKPFLNKWQMLPMPGEPVVDYYDYNNVLGNFKYLLAPEGNSITAYETYWGTVDELKIKNKIYDFWEDSKLAIVKFSPFLQKPSNLAHACVWKVVVNGKDAQDEFKEMDPLGVGTHKFEVYFNRPMDTLFVPSVTMGVREPYNQVFINENGSWSTDSLIYSVYKNITLTTNNGLNRIKVVNGKDTEGFDLVPESERFNVNVQSAGSASAGFMATPGLGMIALDWEVPDETLLADVLGYNMYRFQAITDSTFSDTTKLNTVLINDAQFVDYNVEEAKRYYYQYKILRTSFDETDFSKTVAASPLTSKLGDSNGDFSVDVMDLVQSVDYILGNNPTPFIFKAADVNADTYINVLDIVGTVDIILHPTTKRIATSNQAIQYISNFPIGEALFYWEGNDLYVESKESIAGLQLAFEKDFGYTLSEALPKFEWLNYTQDEQKILMMYSFTGLKIVPGKTKLLSRTSEEATLDISRAAVGTPEGLKLTPIFKDSGELLGIDAPMQTDQAELIKLSPNPSNGMFNLQYYIPEQMDKVLIQIYSLKGEQLWVGDAFKNTQGQATATLNLGHLKDGIYLMVMDVLRSGEIKKREVKKIIISKN